MTSDDLLTTFRQEVVDTVKPYLWSDEECFRYMADAHRMFVRLIGGVADYSGEACSVDMVAGEAEVELHPSILRIMSATKVSDSRQLKVINETDLPAVTNSDYGMSFQLLDDNSPGDVAFMLFGRERGKAKWIKTPLVNDTVKLTVYRLPMSVADGPGKELTDVGEEHQYRLVDWMKYRAYRKADADTFNPKASEESRAEFQQYCSFVKTEWERYKHKPRVVAYGGL
jgi:hypothetical protein